MDALGQYQQLGPKSRELAQLTFVGILLLTALIERLQYRLKQTEGSTWWASNGRDVLNAFALAATGMGLRMLGFPGPICLAIAATLVVVLSVVQGTLDRYPRASVALTLLAALALGAPVLLAPHAVHGFFRGAIELLFREEHG